MERVTDERADARPEAALPLCPLDDLAMGARDTEKTEEAVSAVVRSLAAHELAVLSEQAIASVGRVHPPPV